MSLLKTIHIANFSKLWVAQILALIASYLLNFALIITIYELTKNTMYGTLSVSLIILSVTVPAFLASPMAGAFVDYWNRKRVMVIVNILRAVLVLCYIPASKNVGIIILLTLIISVISQFFIPAEAATIPLLVPKKYLVNANSLFVTSIYTTFIIGYLATAPTITLFSNYGPFLVTALMFTLAAALIAWLPRQITHKKTRILPSINPLHQLKINWSIVRSVQNRFLAVIMIGITQGLMYILITLTPALSSTLLGDDLTSNSYFFIVPVGIGMVIGIVAVNLFPKQINIPKSIIWCLLAVGIVLAIFGIFTITSSSLMNSLGDSISRFAIIIIVGVFGAINAIIATLAQTLLQYNTDDSNRGRVFGSLQMLINFGAILPIFLSGLLSDVLSAGWALVVIGCLVATYGFLILLKFTNPGMVPNIIFLKKR